MSANGGQPRAIEKLNAARFEHAHLWPHFLPDGSHFVFFVLSASPAATGVYVGSVDSADYTMLFQSDTGAVYAPTADGSGNRGFLLYIRGRSLMGVGFNAGRLQLAGDPVMVQDDVGMVASQSLASVSVSRNAALVYQSVGQATRRLVWMDRGGKTVSRCPRRGRLGPAAHFT
ncbi:MAG: hypothetical protein WDO73_29225 [Ignavibacteriota bacterium]